MYLTKREDEVMNILWKCNKEMTIDEIGEYLQSEEWNNQMTLYRTINALEKKKLIEVSGVERRNKQYARKFKAIISQDEYYSEFLLNHGLNPKVLQKISIALLGACELNDGRQEETIRRLETIIDEMESE
ncbi:MAG: BlaI/MecI/CopY family transcriptional regulator [Lachnospiraceae bacterium]|nr:BlaI/MecI/CopY family transcriptional regulator [Lachnospiraceae bacterium]